MNTVVPTANRHILLVEDNADNQFIYKMVLQHSGYTVTTANDGITGLAKAKADRPDLILMDVAIPGVDGWQATSALKKDAATSGIPIIILTAHALATDRARASEVGANGYISKPAEPKTVLAAVENMLADPEYRIGLTADDPAS